MARLVSRGRERIIVRCGLLIIPIVILLLAPLALADNTTSSNTTSNNSSNDSGILDALSGIWDGLSSLKDAILSLPSKIAEKIVEALKTLMPDQLKNLINYIWDFFNAVIEVFKALYGLLKSFGLFFKLFATLLPVIVVVVAIVDPLLVPQVFMEIFEWMRKIVIFIRALIPI